jgi:hypothetical protein
MLTCGLALLLFAMARWNSAPLNSILVEYLGDRVTKAIDRLKDNHPMSLLRNKFWGETMELDEATWRTENADMLNAHAREIEESEEGEFVDYRQGSHVLQFDDELRVPIHKIWVRADYLLLYDELEQGYERTTKFPKSGAVVLTGQPGCG